MTWERIKIIISCGCVVSPPEGWNWDASIPGDYFKCFKHGEEQTIKRMSRVTQK